MSVFVTPWKAVCQASLSITNSRSLLKLISIELMMPSNHLVLCCPLLLLPSIFPSIRIFFNESILHIRWPKCWSFSLNICPSNEYSGLIFLRIDWFDLLAVQGTLKSLLQPHNSKASILWFSAFFMVQLSHPCMITGKNDSFYCMDTHCQSANPISYVQLFETPYTVDCQTPLSMGFPSQKYWSGLALPSPGYLPNPGIEPASLVLAGRFFNTVSPGKTPQNMGYFKNFHVIFVQGPG